MANQTGILRIGTGAGFSSDRLDPAIQLVRKAHLMSLFLNVWVSELWPLRTVICNHLMEWVTTHYSQSG